MPSAPLPLSRPLSVLPGQERLTPREILAYRPHASEPDGPNWTIAESPNKFPALQVEGDMGRKDSACTTTPERNRRPRSHHRNPRS